MIDKRPLAGLKVLELGVLIAGPFCAKVLAAKCWELLKVLCGAGPVSIREASRRVGRDVKAVHSDITGLLNAGVLDRMDGGKIVFSFEAVKVEFLLEAA